ncbi:MAG TPA: hypothetical protein VMT35_13940 [Ignavibacteriaceae bacterium]|nr:hypothetical protein [Ignavibacteriaceae bacterium]
MKSILVTFFLIIFMTSSYSQFTPNKNYIGPSIGLSFLGSTPQFGANYEYGMTWENFGTVGIGGVFRYWGYSEDAFGYGWKYTDILIGAQGNYHFKVDNDKWDPWAGLVLAYDAGSVSWDGPGGYNYATPTYGGLFLGVHGGVRYWVAPTIAISAGIGYGSLSYGALDLGVDFKL